MATTKKTDMQETISFAACSLGLLRFVFAVSYELSAVSRLSVSRRFATGTV
jgi:hypothetical protein